MDDCLPVGSFKVHRQTTLVATESGEEAGRETTQAACVIAFGCRLHLNYIGAEFREHQASRRTHYGVAEFKDPKACQGSRGHQPPLRRTGIQATGVDGIGHTCAAFPERLVEITGKNRWWPVFGNPRISHEVSPLKQDCFNLKQSSIFAVALRRGLDLAWCEQARVLGELGSETHDYAMGRKARERVVRFPQPMVPCAAAVLGGQHGGFFIRPALSGCSQRRKLRNCVGTVLTSVELTTVSSLMRPNQSVRHEESMETTYEFDDDVLSPQRFRFHVLRTLSVGKHRRALIEKQNGICPLCKGARSTLDSRAHVDHIKPVKWFADNLTLPLTEAIFSVIHQKICVPFIHSAIMDETATAVKSYHKADVVRFCDRWKRPTVQPQPWAL